MKYILSLITLWLASSLSAQSTPFDIQLEPMTIQGLGGLQSYTFGQHDGKWLVVGGRLDGLHRRQPFASFDVAGHNNLIWVIDPVGGQYWSAPMTSLPVGIREQLSSTNMQFHQDGDYLYTLGGYGFSASANDHTTYAALTAIQVSSTIDAIINNRSFTGFFRQITEPLFQVTGGHLKKIHDVHYLVGGHKFIGRYNPMGPTSGPGFIQEYTNQIRKFRLQDDGTNIVISHLPAVTDAANLHRRDYNVVSQIMPNGEEGITAFSGVFQPTADLPFLNCVNIDSTGYSVNNAFSQYYNHYHCANVAVHSASSNEMNTVFFGGIAQYYDNAGLLVQDNNVPFVNTIARVTRDAAGVMAEYKLPIVMPSLLGAGSEFIPNPSTPKYDNGVVRFDDITSDTTLLGYIYGGIASSGRNIFFTNTGTQSTASNQLFKVKLIKSRNLGNHVLNEQSVGTLKVLVMPNPGDGDFTVKFFLKRSGDVKITLSTIDGILVEDVALSSLSEGENVYRNNNSGILANGAYLLKVDAGYEKAIQKIIVK